MAYAGNLAFDLTRPQTACLFIHPFSQSVSQSLNKHLLSTRDVPFPGDNSGHSHGPHSRQVHSLELCRAPEK